MTPVVVVPVTVAVNCCVSPVCRETEVGETETDTGAGGEGVDSESEGPAVPVPAQPARLRAVSQAKRIPSSIHDRGGLPGTWAVW